MRTDFTACTVAHMEEEFASLAKEGRELFGGLDATQLNWKPDPRQWSVAQCLDHLLTVDRLMFEAMTRAADPARRISFLERLPVFPRLFGRMMVKSLGPQVTRKFPAPSSATPSASAIDAAIVSRFIDHQSECATRIRELGRPGAERIVMRSPFGPITYSLLNACRIVCAHERRHFEQARRVLTSPGFPHS